LIDSAVVNQQIADGIAAEVSGCEAFKRTLLAEQQALIDGDVDALAKITDKKNSTTDLLNAAAEQRLARVKAVGFTADKDGMQKWIQSTGVGSAPNKSWKSLLTLAAEIQHINEVNGKLIHTRLQVTERTLSVLLAAVNKANLYGPSGRPEGAPQSSNVRGIIGKA
jgi:flagellar biosynthesis/type III secretory pathway chaperone